MEVDIDGLEAALRETGGALDRSTILALVTEVRTLRTSVTKLEDAYFDVSRVEALRAQLACVRTACTCGAAAASSDAP